jgi:membrane protein
VLPSLQSIEAALFGPLRRRWPGGILLQRFARYVWAIGRDLLVGDLNLRAIGLVYTSLLSTVPLCAFSFSVLKGLGFQHNLAPLLAEFFRPLGDHGDELAHRIASFVDHMRGGVVGTLGLTFLLWTAVSVVQKVEEACNHIWHVARPRSLSRRFGEYAGILVIGPIVVATTLGLTAALSSNPWLAPLSTSPLLGWAADHVAPVIAGTLGFGFLYGFLPNTRVSARAALGAAFAASMVWVAAGVGFKIVVQYSQQMVAVYAGFSIVLVTLMWLWLNWLILLTGALLAFYLQHPEYLRSGQRDVVATARLREQLALAIMQSVARAFSAGQRTSVTSLAQQFDVPSIALQPIIDALESAGLLELTSRDQLMPGRLPSAIHLDEIVLAIRDAGAGRAITLTDARTPLAVRGTAQRIDDAIRASLGSRTLQSLAADTDPLSAGGSVARDGHLRNEQ